MKTNPLHWLLFLSFGLWFSTKSIHYINQYNDIETMNTNNLHYIQIIQKKLNNRLFRNPADPILISMTDSNLVSTALLQINTLTFSSLDQTVRLTPATPSN